MVNDRTSANLVDKTDVSPFDSIRHFDENNKEFWTGRELQKLLGYSKWESFGKTIRKASFSCQNAGNPSSEHFFPITGRIESKAGRTAEDWKLTRFACYLVAQNGDPEKPEIAAAQSYFAIKTREAETQQASPKSQAEMLLIYAQQLVEQEQRVQAVEARVHQIEQRSIDAIEALSLLPAPTESAPPLTERDSLRKLINAWCQSNNIEHEKAWRTLYNELYIRDGFSVNARIKNSKATSKLELVVEHGKLGILYAIATEIFKIHGSVKKQI
jgi:BRO family, N-terminal domain